jgi:hypothetical protein
MDGGATDNLGLKGLNQAMEYLHLCREGSESAAGSQNKDPIAERWYHDCSKRLVVVIDAQNGFEGRDNKDYEVRGIVDRFIDRNFLDAYDTLMQTGYGQTLRSSRLDIVEHDSGKKPGTGLLHLPLIALIDQNWSEYGGEFKDPLKCNQDMPPQPRVQSENNDGEAARISCQVLMGARNVVNELLEGRGIKAYETKLRTIPTTWDIDNDQAACLKVAAYALVQGGFMELDKFFDGELEQHEGARARAVRNMDICLPNTNKSPS